MTAAVQTSDLIADALAVLGRLTIAITPVEMHEWVYDRHRHVLRIDPGTDAAAAIAEAIDVLVPVTPRLTVIKDGVVCVSPGGLAPSGETPWHHRIGGA